MWLNRLLNRKHLKGYIKSKKEKEKKVLIEYFIDMNSAWHMFVTKALKEI